VKIGITQRVDCIASYNECRDALDQRLVDWVVEAGCFPVLVPNTLVDLTLPTNRQHRLDEWLQALGIEALLLSGGNDIGKVKQRDLTENYLLSWAKKKSRIPVLGICRGMQVMGVWAGVKLIEIGGHVGTRHQLKIIDEDSQVWPESVNSYHTQVLEECPNSFNVLAKSDDGNIEAIAHKELPWEAWMWHPEREVDFSQHNLDRFRSFVGVRK
jgi:N5-(cytidine 5'-diphosphoramidyl)-L-glutamine hydrolase